MKKSKTELIHGVSYTNGLVDRIVLTGTHGTGKTTLATYLVHQLGAPEYLANGNRYEYRPEPIRYIQEFGFPINQDATEESQYAMSTYHMATLGFPQFIADRCIVDVYAYAKYLHELPNSKISDRCLKFLQEQVYTFIRNFRGIAFMVNADITKPVAQDDIRDTDINFRNGVQAELFMIWTELCDPIRRQEKTGQFHVLPDDFVGRLRTVHKLIDPNNIFGKVQE